MALPDVRLPTLAVLALGACAAPPPIEVTPSLEVAALFTNRQVTGVTVSATGRVFVNFPRWTDSYQGAVAEVLPDGTARPFPDGPWNVWEPDTGLDPLQHFICVQSVVADGGGRLWVLDPAAPGFEGPVPGGAKLVVIDLATERVVRVLPFGPEVAPPGSYLNDLRLDLDRDAAYLTDSGLGAVVVVDLRSGRARRVLVDHPSTKAEPIRPTIGGRPWKGPDGQIPQIHADGIALDVGGENLYYHALTGRHLYRVPTAALRDPRRDLAWAVQDLGPDVVCDGMIMDSRGDVYLTALEHDAIVRRTADGELETVVQDPRLRWPDSLAIGPDGALYVTVSQIHLMARFMGGQSGVTAPWAVYRIDLGLRR